MAFKIAASHAFKTGCKNANPVLLEPNYNIEVTVPEAFMGDILSDYLFFSHYAAVPSNKAEEIIGDSEKLK